MARTSTRVPEHIRQVANSLERILEARGITPTIQSRPSGITVQTIDASPDVQQAVREVCGRHQRGHPHIQSDGYIMDNIRSDVPQCDHVITEHRLTQELRERLEEYSRRNYPWTRLRPMQRDPGFNMDLQSGVIPGFWSTETGETLAPRCCVCRQPVDDTEQAYSSGREECTLYRHVACGDFYPKARRRPQAGEV